MQYKTIYVVDAQNADIPVPDGWDIQQVLYSNAFNHTGELWLLLKSTE